MTDAEARGRTAAWRTLRRNGWLGLALLAACGGHAPALAGATELRLEARRLAETGREGAAIDLYREATRAGDHGAELEAAVVRAGGEPAWVDSLSLDARLHFRVALDAIDEDASTACWAYTGSVPALLSGALLVGAGTLDGGCFLGCRLERDGTPRDALIAAGSALGVAGVVLLVIGAAHDRASERARVEWREALRRARQVTRLELRVGPEIAIAGTF